MQINKALFGSDAAVDEPMNSMAIALSMGGESQAPDAEESKQAVKRAKDVTKFLSGFDDLKKSQDRRQREVKTGIESLAALLRGNNDNDALSN